MDFATAPVVRRALADAVEREAFGYVPRDNPLPEVTSEWLARRYGWDVDPARVHVLPDVLKGVELAVRHFTPESSAIILPTPAYMPFFEVPRATRRPLVQVPTLDLDAIDAAFAGGAGCVILCHPCNPLGHSYTVEEMSALSEVVERHGGLVVADEIHAPLTYPVSRHVPYASISSVTAAHTVTAVSATKAWNLPGLKCAQVVVGNEERWGAISSLETHGSSSLGVVASIAAYRHGEAWLDEVVEYLDSNRRELAGLVEEHLPGAVYTMPDATYLAWIDCRPLRLEEEPAEFFLREAKVATSPGPAFGGDGPGHIRFNFATSKDLVRRMFEAMGAALAQHSHVVGTGLRGERDAGLRGERDAGLRGERDAGLRGERDAGLPIPSKGGGDSI
jgi:cystathionine beta-lyase